MSKRIDQSFLFKHYFSAFLHQIDERAFAYYQKAEGLVANQGSLYDEVPAALKGNVYDINNPELTVLGYVEISLVDTIRLAIERGELNLIFEDECRPRSGTIVCKTLPAQKDTLRPCKCYDCEFVYGLETDIKPDFWEE